MYILYKAMLLHFELQGIPADAIPLEMNAIPNLEPTWHDNNKQLTPTFVAFMYVIKYHLFSTPHNLKT